MISEEDLPSDARTLSPLPPILRRGLAAVTFFGFLSFISSVGLFLFLTYRLIYWKVTGQVQRGYNQFLLLIYNLLLADIQQSSAFILPIEWLVEDRIHVRTSTCWAQGWFVSTGDLASGVWILAIAVHTYFAIVKGFRLSNAKFSLGVVILWVFIYAMAIIGVALHPNDYYARAKAWCWVNRRYENLRLLLHYLYIFIAMFGVIIIYGIIFLRLRLRAASANAASSAANHRAARYMIIYPTVYVLCTLPLAAGRMASMTGDDVPLGYFCLAGAMITSCGWLDVLLYALTRRVLVFSEKPPPVDDLGVDTFAVWDVGQNGVWGTHTVITGGSQNRRRSRTEGESESMDDLCRNSSVQPGFVKTDTVVEVNSHPNPHGSYVMKDMRPIYPSGHSSGSKDDISTDLPPLPEIK